ncbi:hypothetical protein DC425_16860 [Sphingomonas sp. TPD3009]|nr:hypothetical protein DC425_16860 [Sphingomonas sp. TPD3009]
MEAHRFYQKKQEQEEKRMKAFTLSASLSVAGMSYSLGQMLLIFFGTRTPDSGAMMLRYAAALMVSAALGYASAKMAERYARRYDNYNGMLPERKRSRNPNTPFWR